MGLSQGALTSALDLDKEGATDGVSRSVAELEMFYDKFRDVAEHAMRLQVSAHSRWLITTYYLLLATY